MQTTGRRAQPFPFIVGCGRSGTSLLRSMFDSHPEMAIPPETYFVVRLARRTGVHEAQEGFSISQFMEQLVNTGGFRRTQLDPDAVRETLSAERPLNYPDAIRLVYALYAKQQGKNRYGDKTPIYILYIPLLSALFPEARFIHIIRDGRDVARSFQDLGWADRLEDVVLYWKLQVSRGRRAGSALGPDRYREIRYEQLVEDPEEHLKDLCEFVRIEYDPAMLDFQESGLRWASVSRDPAPHGNLGRHLTRGLRDWRSQMDSRDVAIAQGLAGGLLTGLGYELADVPARPTIALDVGRRWVAWQGRRIRSHVRRRSPSSTRTLHERATPFQQGG